MPNTVAATTVTVEAEAWSGSFTAAIIGASDNSYASHDTTTYAAAEISDFVFNVPINASSIDGIVVTLEANNGNTANPAYIRLSLSWDNGTTWTATKEQAIPDITDTVYAVGGASDTWGHAWTVAQFAVGTFQMRVEGKRPTGGSYIYLDHLTCTVYYSAPAGFLIFF